MPINKNVLIRFLALDKCFSNHGRNYFIEDLLEACNAAIFSHNENASGIQKRQLFEDIKFMESANGWEIPLERNRIGKRVFYRYSDSNFSINMNTLSCTEFDKIKEAMEVFKRIKGIPDFHWIRKLFLKLEENFVLKNDTSPCISFENNEYLKGLDFLGDLFHYIVEKKVLTIRYQPFQSSEVSEWLIHPYYLKQFNSRWFLFGYNPAFETISNLALDRIQSFEVVHVPFASSKVDFETYFEDVYGVTISSDSQLTKLVLKASPSLAPYILTKPIHGSQKRLSLSEEGLLFSIEVFPNYELEKNILSFGEELILLEPKSLRDKLQDRIFKMIQKYDEIHHVSVLRDSEKNP